MCGRFTQHYTWKEMHDQLDVFGTPQNLKPNWNVAPTQSVDAVRVEMYLYSKGPKRADTASI